MPTDVGNWGIERFQIPRTAENLRPRNQSPRSGFRRKPPRRSDRPSSARIIPLMTPVRTHANEVGSPSLPQLLLDALLRLFVELVQNVVATLRLRRSGQTCDWHTGPIANALPEEKTDPIKEIHAVQPDSPIALMLSSTQSVRPTKHERVLTTRATPTESFLALCRESRLAHHRGRQLIVPLIPAKAGTQGSPRSLSGAEASIPGNTHHRSWIPASAGMSGDGFVRTTAP